MGNKCSNKNSSGAPDDIDDNDTYTHHRASRKASRGGKLKKSNASSLYSTMTEGSTRDDSKDSNFKKSRDRI